MQKCTSLCHRMHNKGGCRDGSAHADDYAKQTTVQLELTTPARYQRMRPPEPVHGVAGGRRHDDRGHPGR